MLAVPAFDGKAGSYVIRSDGRIVINRTMGKGEPIYNFLAALRERSDLSEKEILAFSRELQQEQSGARTVTAGGEKFYLLYERLDIRDWITVGMVPRFGFMQPSCHFPNGKYTLPAPRKRNRKGKRRSRPRAHAGARAVRRAKPCAHRPKGRWRLRRVPGIRENFGENAVKWQK